MSDYFRESDIIQFYMNNHFYYDEIAEKINLEKYVSKEKSTLFINICTKKDIDILNNHKSKKIFIIDIEINRNFICKK